MAIKQKSVQWLSRALIWKREIYSLGSEAFPVLQDSSEMPSKQMTSSNNHPWSDFLSRSILSLVLSGHSCVKTMTLFGYTSVSGSRGVESRLPSQHPGHFVLYVLFRAASWLRPKVHVFREQPNKLRYLLGNILSCVLKKLIDYKDFPKNFIISSYPAYKHENRAVFSSYNLYCLDVTVYWRAMSFWKL